MCARKMRSRLHTHTLIHSPSQHITIPLSHTPKVIAKKSRKLASIKIRRTMRNIIEFSHLKRQHFYFSLWDQMHMSDLNGSILKRKWMWTKSVYCIWMIPRCAEWISYLSTALQWSATTLNDTQTICRFVRIENIYIIHINWWETLTRSIQSYHTRNGIKCFTDF